jgi:hypothetical protein
VKHWSVHRTDGCTAYRQLLGVMRTPFDRVRILFRLVMSQAADREIDDFMTAPRTRQG